MTAHTGATEKHLRRSKEISKSGENCTSVKNCHGPIVNGIVNLEVRLGLRDIFKLPKLHATLFIMGGENP